MIRRPNSMPLLLDRFGLAHDIAKDQVAVCGQLGVKTVTLVQVVVHCGRRFCFACFRGADPWA